MRGFEPHLPHRLEKMKKTNSSDGNLTKLIAELDSESKLVKRVASDLSRPSRIRREVNLTRLNRFTKENDVIIVPGKVLGGGELNHKITISAYKFSEGALSKLEKGGSKIIPIGEIVKQKNVRIIG